jgi:hypothetical protein
MELTDRLKEQYKTDVGEEENLGDLKEDGRINSRTSNKP